MYKAIYTIVDKGRGEDVVKSAGEAGAKGGTIINARGSGIHETAKLFAMEIEPEKEIVLIILKTEQTDAVIDKISKDMELEKPGTGILFVLDVADAYGLRK